jgi:hypothetical protein
MSFDILRREEKIERTWELGQEQTRGFVGEAGGAIELFNSGPLFRNNEHYNFLRGLDIPFLGD